MQDDAGRGPRLRMGHLLIWVVGCAIGFAEQRPIMRVLDSSASDRDRVLAIGSSVVWGIAIGTILAGCGLLAYRRWRGDLSCPSRAGHWLMLRALALHAVNAAPQYAGVHLSIFVLYWIYPIIDVAFLWGLRRRLPRHWVAVFLVSTVLSAIRAVGFAAFAYSRFPLAAISIGSVLLDVFVILRAVGRDRHEGAPADGLHRLGVGTALALDAFSLIFNLVLILW